MCMGKLEKENRKRIRRNTIKKIILASVATAGVLSVALVAPNIFIGLKKLGFTPKRLNTKRSRDSLVKGGFLYYEGSNLRLTKKGENELYKLEQNNFVIKKPRKWDKKWRVLIFDIPENKRWIRQKIRMTLRSIGFLKLQNSVWVYPYDCEDYINLIKSDLKVGRSVLYMIVDSIEYDNNIKKHFKLP
jgi:CRISPR-associated endonuclease Cas2